ncbi:MAG: apolipoprotein N-acyltransferase [Candidatus Omnitrophica bacterium]|nr:apolipoprotein N-acyltransferase [Candidatus Omnitrophota bacterium]
MLSSGMLILSFPRFNLEFLAWVGFVPVFFALKNKTLWQSFLLFFITGIVFWSGIIYWLVNVTLPGTIVLILYLALYFGVFALIIRPFTKRSAPYVLIFIPSVWVLLEFSRSHLLTGFPWALLGYSQYLHLQVIQIADITGVWGVSFLVMAVNVAIVEIAWSWLNRIQPRLRISIAFLVSLLLLAFFYGSFRLSGWKTAGRKNPIRISVIQGNIPQELKWDIRARGFIMERYFDISADALKDRPDFMVWPEASLPVALEDVPYYFESVKNFAREIKTPVLVGAVTLRDGLYYNSALLVSRDGETAERYDKLHLVPFGEYIPLRAQLPFLEAVVPIADFTPGKEYTIFNVTSQRPGGNGLASDSQSQRPQATSRFSVLICFEDLFPQLSREFVKKGAQFLINVTNDAWFGKTSSAEQHLSASVFRAAENRVSLVRSANTGISGFIAPTGKIVSSVKDASGNDIFTPGYKTQDIYSRRGGFSFYTRYGDIFIFALIIFVIYCIFRFKS